MQYIEMIENENRLATTIEGRQQLRDVVWFIVDYVKTNRRLPPEGWRNDLHQGMGVRRSKVDETINALDSLARTRHYEKLVSNPFQSLV